MTTTVAPESLDEAFAGERDVMGVVFALYELVLPGFDRESNGTDGGHPSSSEATWKMVDEAFERWVKSQSHPYRNTKAGLRKDWPWATLNYGFNTSSGQDLPLGEVDISAVTVTERGRR